MCAQALTIPSDVKKATNDYVTYHYLNPDGTKKKLQSTACYAAIMSSLTKVAIRCQAREKNANPVDAEHYNAWMALCKQHRLIPRKASFYSEAGNNFLDIPAGAYDKHLVYSALCCYRFSESFAPMVWQIVEHSKKLPGVTFWQLLHYGLATHYTYGSGHSFSMIYTGSSGVYGNKERSDLAQSIALKVFFSRTIRARKGVTGYTNQTISDLAKSLGGHTTKAVSSELKKAQDEAIAKHGYISANLRLPVNVPMLKVVRFEDLLTPKWTPLFLCRRPTSEKLRKLYQAG